ncbi:MAG: glycosyltransferase family 39 protein [Lachnospiraceae bacterium]|nr:glycosyltransferase family 39 protein [Lachnospiraceae bacterium]
MRVRDKISDYFSDSLNRYRFAAIAVFTVIITALAWQSDDAYHAYVMAKHLVEGNGFVYNIGERATASSCPLFTLIIAGGYFVFRNMFLVSLLICIVFSTLAFRIVIRYFCRNRKQILMTFAACVGSVSFISYTTSGLENCLLFFLTALFLHYYYTHETYTGRQLLYMGILISLIAMTRMDAVLMFVPVILYIYLGRRERVSLLKAVPIGILSLLPFILWELFSVFYYGFPFPNTAYVKLGTDIALKEYIIRGLQYLLTTTLCDLPLISMIVFMLVSACLIRRAKISYVAAGVFLYLCYIIYIGGDFMLGRHFTVCFLISVITCLYISENGFDVDYKNKRLERMQLGMLAVVLIFAATTGPVTDQFLYGHEFNSPIADERDGYFRFTSLFNNTVSYLRTGEMCIRNAWNEQGIDEYREMGLQSGILQMVPGISIYYNSDMYLNDWYGLGDPFLSKLPAVKEENWRIGHMWREPPRGYEDTVAYGDNEIENEDLKQYYEIIKLITRGSLFDAARLRAVIDMNLGRYDYLLDSYRESLGPDGRQQ